VDSSVRLIDLTQISAPTLVICGDQDPYLNYPMVYRCLNDLPDGSALEIIPGGSHVVYVEKPCYHVFQERLLRFLHDEISVNDILP
jgi:pimeloyl-ACP methyl ester carboxylesterase